MFLYYQLVEKGAATCALDEHVRARIKEVAALYRTRGLDADIPEELRFVAERLISQTFDDNTEIIAWGAGAYANAQLDNSIDLKDVKVKFFVDSSPQKQGTKFRGVDVFHPDQVLSSDLPILISASFYYHEIYDQLVDMGVDTSRILPNTLI